MTEEQDRLVHHIRTLADRQAPTGAVPVSEILQRGRRARRTRRALRVAIGTGAVALAVTVAAVVAPRTPAAPPAGPVASLSPSPATADSHTGYHVALTYTIHSGEHPDHDIVETFHGAADPANRRGYLSEKEFELDIRILGDDEYSRPDPRGWRTGIPGVGPRGTLPLARLMAVEPQQLLTELRDRGTVTRSGGGQDPAGSETYTFSYVAKDSDYTGEIGAAGNTLTGSVVLVGGRYRTVTIRTVLTAPNLGDADPDPITRTSVLEFSDYGTPVHVERPQVTPPPVTSPVSSRPTDPPALPSASR